MAGTGWQGLRWSENPSPTSSGFSCQSFRGAQSSLSFSQVLQKGMHWSCPTCILLGAEDLTQHNSGVLGGPGYHNFSLSRLHIVSEAHQCQSSCSSAAPSSWEPKGPALGFSFPHYSTTGASPFVNQHDKLLPGKFPIPKLLYFPQTLFETILVISLHICITYLTLHSKLSLQSCVGHIVASQ